MARLQPGIEGCIRNDASARPALRHEIERYTDVSMLRRCHALEPTRQRTRRNERLFHSTMSFVRNLSNDGVSRYKRTELGK